MAGTAPEDYRDPAQFFARTCWRVRRRVELGGRDVPETVVRRRFWKSLVNFDRLYRRIATTWRLYDGGGLGGRPMVARRTGAGELTITDAAKWHEIQRQIEEAT